MARLGIVGVGLMGGSLALAARGTRLFSDICGADKSAENLKIALDRGIIDRAMDFDDLIATSDFLTLATPVENIVSLIPSLVRAKKSAVFTDLGSVKSEVIRAIPAEIRPRFVAAHPMCGTEYSGPQAAFSTLYSDRIVVFCGTEANSPEAFNAARELFEAIGMRVVEMNAEDHDRHAAFISHLPHAISYALANSVLKQEDRESILTLAAGGFRDMSRLAKSAPSMWVDIFRQNREALLTAIVVFNEEMGEIERALIDENWTAIEAVMRSANDLHEIFTLSSQDR